MPRAAAVQANLNRKVTDFFPKVSQSPNLNLKTRRVDQIIEISSSTSENKSVISISSDDNMPSSSSKRAPFNPKLKDARLPNSKQSKGAYRSKQSSGTQSTLSSQRASPEPTHPCRSSRSSSKRMRSVISAEDSSDNDTPLPAIVLTSGVIPIDDPTTVTPKSTRKYSRLSPFTPRQNLELPAVNKVTPIKLSHLSPSARKLTPKTNIEKHPSPFKRPRYHSPEKNVAIISDSDADDEKEQCEPPVSTPPQSDSTGGVGLFMDSDMDIDDMTIPASTAPLISFDESTITTPISKKSEIVPSSQHAEMEVDKLELGAPSSSDEKDRKTIISERLTRLSSATAPVLSPCSARTLSIINEIKARAEKEAALEAEKSRSRASLGLTSDDNSDLTSLSDGSDDLSLDLNLDLGLPGKDRGQASQPQTEPKAPAQGVQVRRSARHQDVPAPNYKVKLSLVRENTPPSLVSVRASKAATTQKCPLDKIVKESVSLKATAELEASLRASSRATSVDIVDYGPETPQRPRLISEGGFDPDSPFLGGSIKIEDHEAMLGKEASDAVGKILQNDRKKRKEQMLVRVESFSVWDDATMVTEDSIPDLQIDKSTSPLIASLKNALDVYDYDTAGLLIGSGALFRGCQSSQLPQLLVWVFKLVFTVQSVQLLTSAYGAILSLQLERFPADWLTEDLIHWVLQRLGLKTSVLQILGISKSYGKVEDPKSKISIISFFLTILSTASRAQGLPEATIPYLTTTLVILGMDTLISSSLRCATIVAIEAILSERTFSRETELSISKAVHQAVVKLDFTFDEQARLIGLFSGCSPVSSRVRRWIAWSMLGGDLDSLDTAVQKGEIDFPPFSNILNLFLKDASPGGDGDGSGDKVKMTIHNGVDYKVLGAQTDILSMIMTDVEGYTRQTGGKEFVEDVYRNLDRLLGKINDTRAAHLDRSKTKDAMNRLRNRLQYQLEAAIQVLRPRKDRLDHFFEKKPKSAAASAAVG